MSRIDLHLHTTYSDGTLTPTELVQAAAERGVTLMAVTDHDEIGGIGEARAAGRHLGVRVVSGVEINTEVGREDVHVLGYGFPVDSVILHDGLACLRQSRMTRALAMLERLRAIGYPVEAARLLEISGHGSIGRPHVAQAMVDAGHVQSQQEAFERFIGSRGPAYVRRTQFTPEEAIALIHRAGGIAVLAHPGKLGDPVRFIRRLHEIGLDGLEAYHSDHTPNVAERMARWARQYNLLITGGTDSHGPRGPRTVSVGSVPVPDEVEGALLAALVGVGFDV